MQPSTPPARLDNGAGQSPNRKRLLLGRERDHAVGRAPATVFVGTKPRRSLARRSGRADRTPQVDRASALPGSLFGSGFGIADRNKQVEHASNLLGKRPPIGVEWLDPAGAGFRYGGGAQAVERLPAGRETPPNPRLPRPAGFSVVEFVRRTSDRPTVGRAQRLNESRDISRGA